MNVLSDIHLQNICCRRPCGRVHPLVERLKLTAPAYDWVSISLKKHIEWMKSSCIELCIIHGLDNYYT